MADISSATAAGMRRGWGQDSQPPTSSYGQAGESQPSSTMPESPKQRKRSRKRDSEKKFECKHEGCGKSYSRAEHLYRHQLNHNPKQIYRCKFPNCTRAFVRQDLCIRHQERHNTHGSQLQKRDSFAAHSAKGVAATPTVASDTIVSDQAVATPVSTDSVTSPKRSNLHFSQSPASTANTTFASTQTYSTPSSTTSAPLEPNYPAPSTSRRKHPDPSGVYAVPPAKQQPVAIYEQSHRHPHNSYGTTSTYQGVSFSAPDVASGVSTTSSSIRHRHLSLPGPTSHHNAYLSPSNTINGSSSPNGYLPQRSIQVSPMSPHDYSNTHLGGPTTTTIANAISNGLGTIGPVSGATISDLDSITQYALPVFGGETLNRSPFAMTDDFTAWLFNEPNSSSVGYSSVPGMLSNPSDPFVTQLQNHYFPADPAFAGYYTNVIQQQQQQQQQQPQQQHPMSVTSILDTGPPQSIISEDKRNEILDLIQNHFNETDQVALKKRKESLVEGNMDGENHVLGLRMMQIYVSSYWYHCHDQLPILHRPTFSPSKTPNLLLLAVMALGASTLEKEHGQAAIEAAADFSNFVAWHLRWEIFRDPDFRPPAKLWVFQTLLLLETYEKMFSTRALHERAHIHHDTTLTLMRRGSSLIGRSALDSPPSPRDDGPNRPGSGSGANSTAETTPGEESWVRWIKAEATRRVAFAAFVLDTIHATMFGHSAKMVAHELRLPLPCDEALWSATNAAEVARVQSSLTSNGVKPTLFLDALKKTLNGQNVRTNSFGRTIIMAGLLSVSWHMNQRDLQVTSLGVSHTLGGRDKWRSALIRAFDNWRRDFDEALVTSTPANNTLHRNSYAFDGDVFFESRTVLHHLAHMASHVDIVDCQIFAGASRLLGRSITPRDYSSAREKMTDRWATKAPARDATFYALKFIRQVLIPNRNSSPRCSYSAYVNSTEYSARNDFLLNRPWVLYFAALVVWCYGYALEGPITPPVPELATSEEQREDMHTFLDEVGGVQSPVELEKIRGRNRCMGLLMVLRETFLNTRWELLNEAAILLGSCIDKLKGSANGS
ncbi:hypothetical protein D8B26_004460 [Coccidioides posadasii str. Silveira]|uniref:Uncharacterized protein n=2 Tax=Coccidioides posadasii TaxID=199306 RepID=E9DEZ8_COCPS|nr:hypothetical protein CPSG_08398 [Coccidioides posadasii str. Silveira]KMM69018.1 hypothetical protein CPAG_05341 [Coccidioides posadasii RMSCC 3488]QVM09800.1 hypothetical protein D8B26_004460 [Coccidioides posadasii str. Silveira]